jgi:flagellar basal body-associated protein FliL
MQKMDFKDAEKIVEAGKTKFKRTLFIIILLLVLIAVIAYIKGFFGEKGKQHAGSSNESHWSSNSPSREIQHQEKNTNAPVINQHTEGDQSPAIISNDVNITYGAPKDQKTKE